MYHPKGEKLLKEHAEVIQTNNYDTDHLKSLVADVDGVVLRAPARINKDILDAAKNVKVISGAGVGLDNIDVTYATKKGIPVLHAPKVNTNATAEHTIGLLFGLSKKLIPFHQEMEKGNFSSRDNHYTFELKGKTLGLIGWGDIAQKVASIGSSSLGMKVVSYVRNVDVKKKESARNHHVELTEHIEQVMEESDFVSLHIPLTKNTTNLIDRNLLGMMKQNAFLINTARGGIVNETDLYHALKEKRIAGAGIDVFSLEPPSEDHPFFDLDNVLLTPHVGGISEEAAEESSYTVARNLITVLKGDKVSSIANPACL